jgi:hypothetical protein
MSIRACLLTVLGVLAAAEPGPPASSLRVDTGDALHLLVPGKEDALALVVANPRPQAVRLRLGGRLRELEGDGRAVALEFDVPARGETRLPLDLGSRRTGIRYLDYRLEGAGLPAEEGRTSFLYAAPVGGGPDPAGFLYGVSSHPDRGGNSDADRENEMIATARAGLGIMRLDATWTRIEPKPGVWDWTLMDRLVELGARHGVEMQMLLAYGNPHSASPAAHAAFAEAKRTKQNEPWAWLQRMEPPEAPWRAFVAATTAHFRGQVHLWEVWNEPDLAGFWRDSTDAYLRVLRAAAEEIRRADPANRVLTGGFATVQEHGGRSLNPDLQERVLAEASDAFDLHAYHGHGPFFSFRASVDGELARMRARMPQPRPLYFNETALTSLHHGERVQAWALVKKLAFARARGAVGYTWYDLRNDGWNPADAEHHYGMLQRDFRPKAVYAACLELTRRMRGTRFIGELALGPGRLGFVFAGSGRRLVVLWNEDSGLGDEPIALRAPGCEHGSAVDLMGNAAPLPALDGTVLARPALAPSYLELPGGEGLPEVLRPLVAVQGEVVAAPGERVPVPLRLANPLATPLPVTLEWTSGADLRRHQVLLPAHGEELVRLEALSPPGTAWNANPTFAVRFAAGGSWQGDLAIPIQTVVTVPADAPARAPDFTIDTYAAVVNYCEADPAQQANTWQGPQDLSARIWLARDGQALRLRLRVAVRDDRHVQAGPARDSWAGDGLQIAFVVPGQKGYWEVGAARANDGTALAHLWLRPAGSTTGAEAVSVATTPAADGMLYEVALPYAAFGLDDALLERGLRFNLIVNDNDGDRRKGFVRIAPGIGEGKDPSGFPRVRFAPVAGGGR